MAMRDFDETLGDVFGERTGSLSEDLREMLKELWREGVKYGLYLERERLPVPKDILARRPRRKQETESQEEDPRTAPGKIAELEKVVEKLVDKAEVLSGKIEANLDFSPTLALRGVDLMKARHRFLTQAEKLDRDLNALIHFVEGFQIHSY
jgi:hypothetical protein